MFSGIVEAMGKVKLRSGGKFGVALPWPKDEMGLGQSVAVDGCCLTIASWEGSDAVFDLSPETLARTTLGLRNQGDKVNLERGLRLGTSIDGHLVSGHIDNLGKIRRVEPAADGNRQMWIDAPAEGRRWLVQKGSVAVDGISLTVNDVDQTTFSVMLIPHTLQVTTLGERKAGDAVNIEFDLIAKYVERMMEARAYRAEGEHRP